MVIPIREGPPALKFEHRWTLILSRSSLRLATLGGGAALSGRYWFDGWGPDLPGYQTARPFPARHPTRAMNHRTSMRSPSKSMKNSWNSLRYPCHSMPISFQNRANGRRPMFEASAASAGVGKAAVWGKSGDAGSSCPDLRQFARGYL